jgi:hypothetical protein
MPQMEQEDFKFPDEQEETQGKPVDTEDKIDISVEDDEVEIEVKDDTPLEDRGRDPVPEDIKKELEEADTSADYSRNVKEKFTQYKKAWHDERRQKEAALREQQEALNIAQKILDENKKLKEMLQSGEKELISTYQTSAELEFDKAKKAYKDAYDSGDSDRILEAHEEMTKAQLKLDKAKNFKPTVQISENDVQIPQKQSQQPAQLDPKVADWVSKNQWFVDPRKRAMRKFAEGIHEELEETYGRGYVGTDAYYTRIDDEVKRRFPEEFADIQNDEEEKPQRTSKLSTVVAPAKRSTSSKKVVLTKSQMATIKKLGISPEQYVREQQKLGA